MKQIHGSERSILCFSGDWVLWVCRPQNCHLFFSDLSAIKKQCGDMVAFTLTYILGMRFGTWTVPYLKALKEGLCLRAGAQSLTNAQWLGHGSETTALLQMPAILFFQTFQQGKQVPHGFFWVSGWQQVIAELILEVHLRLWCFTMREGLTNKSSLR